MAYVRYCIERIDFSFLQEDIGLAHRIRDVQLLAVRKEKESESQQLGAARLLEVTEVYAEWRGWFYVGCACRGAGGRRHAKS
jgi:hypothetical protein